MYFIFPFQKKLTRRLQYLVMHENAAGSDSVSTSSIKKSDFRRCKAGTLVNKILFNLLITNGKTDR